MSEFNPGDMVYHRNLKRYGVVSVEIMQKDCDSTSVCVDFNRNDTMEVSKHLLDKVS